LTPKSPTPIILYNGYWASTNAPSTSTRVVLAASTGSVPTYTAEMTPAAIPARLQIVVTTTLRVWPDIPESSLIPVDPRAHVKSRSFRRAARLGAPPTGTATSGSRRATETPSEIDPAERRQRARASAIAD